MPHQDALRHPIPQRYDGIGRPLPHPSALPDPDPHFVRSQPTGGEPPPYHPDLSLIAEQETNLTKRWTELGAGYMLPDGETILMPGTLDLGLVTVEPWRWWMRFVPGRPRTVHHLRSFPPGPTQDEDARAWWESLS